MTPAGVIRSMRALPDASFSGNHRLPSEPTAMPSGLHVVESHVVGEANSVIAPAGVTRPTAFSPGSVNHTLPSGPAVTFTMTLFAPSPDENSDIDPSALTRPTRPNPWCGPASPNHTW